MIELIVFVVAGAACLAGALGVVLSRNPVHSALALVGTLFGIAVLFIAQEANFLAAVQVIVYAGAIVVLFLFVIMLLGVDRAENLKVEPLVGQRVAAGLVGLAVLALSVTAMASTDFEVTGVAGAFDPDRPDIDQLGESLFRDYLYAFEITSLLLVIAIVGAVILARRPKRNDEIVDPGQAEEEAEIAAREARAEARARGEAVASAEAGESEHEHESEHEEVGS
ncbi:MAG TPA: NADH-quinone oxidoreductase subunit J [Acidimicrobiales bacterium]